MSKTKEETLQDKITTYIDSHKVVGLFDNITNMLIKDFTLEDKQNAAKKLKEYFEANDNYKFINVDENEKKALFDGELAGLFKDVLEYKVNTVKFESDKEALKTLLSQLKLENNTQIQKQWDQILLVSELQTKVGELNSKVEDFNDQLKKNEDKTATVQTSVETMQAELTTAQFNSNSLMNQINELIKAHALKLEEVKNKGEEALTTLNGSYEEKMGELIGELAKQQDLIIDQTTQLSTLQEKLTQSMNESKITTIKLNELVLANDNLKNELTQSKVISQNEMSQLKDKLDNQAKEFVTGQDNTAILLNNVTALKQENSDLQKQTKELKTQNDELITKVSNFEDQSKTLNNEVTFISNQLNQQVQQSEQDKITIDTMKSNVIKLSENSLSLTQKIQELTNLNENNSQEVVITAIQNRKTIEKLQQKLQIVTDSMEKATNELKVKENAFTESMSKVETLEKNLEDLTKKNQELEEKIKLSKQTGEKEKNELTEKLNSMNETTAAAKKEVTTLSVTLTELKEITESLQKNNNELITKNQELNNKNVELVVKVEQLSQKLETATNSLTNQENEIKAVRSQLTVMQTDLTNAQKKSDELSQKISSLSEEHNKELSSLKTNNETALTELKKQHENDKNELSKQLLTQQETIIKQQKEVELQKEILKTGSVEVNDIKTQLEELRKKNVELNNTFDEKIILSSTEKEELKQKLKQQTEEINKSQENASKLSTQVNNLTDTLNQQAQEFQEIKNNFTQEIDSLKTEMKSKDDEIKKLKDSLQFITEQLANNPTQLSLQVAQESIQTLTKPIVIEPLTQNLNLAPPSSSHFKWEKIYVDHKDTPATELSSLFEKKNPGIVSSNDPKQNVAPAKGILAAINISHHAGRAPSQDELDAFNKGEPVEVRSPSGHKYHLSYAEGIPKAVLMSTEINSDDVNDEHEKIKLALTIMNMIDNVLSKGTVVNLCSPDPFVVKIAEQYIAHLKKTSKGEFTIEGSIVNSPSGGAKDTGRSEAAEAIFKTLSEKLIIKDVENAPWYQEAKKIRNISASNKNEVEISGGEIPLIKP